MRYFHLILGAIFFVAVVLRSIALLDLQGSIYSDFLLLDESLYHSLALSILKGMNAPPSIYAYMMALVYKVLSVDILYIRIMNLVFGVMTCYLIYLIGREMTDRTGGLIACLMACLYEPFIFYSIVPMKTSLTVLLFACTVFLCLALMGRHSLIKVILLGFAVVALFKLRPNAIVLVPLLPLLIVWNLYQKGSSLKKIALTVVLYGVGVVLCLSPIALKSYLDSGSLGQTISQIGFNLYLGNNLKNPDPYYLPVPFAEASPLGQWEQFTIEASRRVGKTLSPPEASSYWTREVLKSALEHPGAFGWKMAQKVLALFNRFEAGDHYHVGFVSRFITFFKLPFLSLWLILPLGMAGMAITGLKSGKHLCATLIFLVYGATMVLFFTNSRYRLPLMVVLIPFAVAGINHLVTFWKNGEHSRVGVYLAITLAFFIIEFLPVRGTGDMTAYYNTHAIILYSKGFETQAAEYWEVSSDMKGRYSDFANFSLAGYYANIDRDLKRAAVYLDHITDDSYIAAQKYDLIGDVSMARGLVQKATASYERALEINSGLESPREKLIRIYWKTDRIKAFQEYDKLEQIKGQRRLK